MATINWNESQFREGIQGAEPVLVDFWAPWCGYCRRIGPAVEALAAERPDLTVAKINIDMEQALAEQEKIDVIPTLALYQAGKRLGAIVAPDSKAKIEAFIRDTLRA